MDRSHIDYKQTGFFSKLVIDYLDDHPGLQPFYRYYPTFKNFSKLIGERTAVPVNRGLLVQVLKRQYSKGKPDPSVINNIELLRDANTFTVTTGHQLNMLTGPLYFIYKIISTINLAKKLKEENPNFNIVPVYWMATEDHDFEEISHVNLFGNTLQWEKPAGGPAGRIDPHSLASVIDQAEALMGTSETAERIISLLRNAYLSHSTLAEATRYLTGQLFAGEGLVILDADDSELKNSFKEIITEDIIHQHSFRRVSQTIAALEKSYDIQVNPREINFFYMEDHFRERIVWEEERYKVLNTSLSWTEEELKMIIAGSPERFSPNVIMRGLYQEFILPNLAYIGGGAEIAYWIELKELFEQYKLSFPVLILRNSAMIIDEPARKKIQRLGFSPAELFMDQDLLVRRFLEQNEGSAIELGHEKDQLISMYNELAEKATAIDPTLKNTVLAEQTKAVQSLEVIEDKLRKALKKKHDIHLQQVIKIKEKLFPERKLQERHDNLFAFLIAQPDLLKQLISSLDPLDFRLVILS